MSALDFHVILTFGGEFRKTGYYGGKSVTISNLQVDTFSYTVLMEYVKETTGCSEIGGVYIQKDGSWKLVNGDGETLQHVGDSWGAEGTQFHIDTSVDPDSAPLPQTQPHVVVRPRPNILQVNARRRERIQFTTTHQLQQQCQDRKKKKKSPALPKPSQVTASPRVLTRQRKADLDMQGRAKRKLNLEDSPSDDDESGESDRSSEEPPQPPPKQPITDYEKKRMLRVQENKKAAEDFGLKRIADSMKIAASKTNKGKDKIDEAGDDYYPSSGSEDSTENTSTRRVEPVLNKKAPAGPRTRSRANARIEADATENDAATIQKPGRSSVRDNALKPTCSKLLKQGIGSVAPGSVAAYLALRERQNQGLDAPTSTEVSEPNDEETTDKETKKAPRRPRGRSKLTKVHARSAEKRPLIILNEEKQPLTTDGQVDSELSRFLGTVAKDNVPLTYVNWRCVPADLKKKMWDYTREKYILLDDAKWWVNRTLSDLWRVHKSRMKKKYYTRYDTDEERMQNRPDDIPVEDFKLLLNYWGAKEVKELAEENTARHNSYTDTHTLGPKTLAQVRADLKKKAPLQAPPSGAQLYLQTRKRMPGREYKPTSEAVVKKLERIQKMMALGQDPETLFSSGNNGKKRGREWLVGRSCNKGTGTSDQYSTDPFLDVMTKKIRTSLQGEFAAEVNRQVQDNISMMLKRLGEANPGMNLDIGDFCAVASSEDDENGSPLTNQTENATPTNQTENVTTPPTNQTGHT